jgi:hypothetical protein
MKPAGQTNSEAKDRTRNRNRNDFSRRSRGHVGIDPHLVKRGTEPEYIAGDCVCGFMRSDIQREGSHKEQCRTDRDTYEVGRSRASLIAA